MMIKKDVVCESSFGQWRHSRKKVMYRMSIARTLAVKVASRCAGFVLRALALAVFNAKAINGSLSEKSGVGVGTWDRKTAP